MKLYIDTDEAYPVFYLYKPGDPGYEFAAEVGVPIAMTDEELADYESVRGRYRDWQNRLRRKYGYDT